MCDRPPAAIWFGSPPAAGNPLTRPAAMLPTGNWVALDRAGLLCIRDGRGLRLRVVSGVLWVTEDGSTADHVLRAGDSVQLARDGIAIASAVQPAHVVIDMQPGDASPREIELVRADGTRRRLALAAPAALRASPIAATLATFIDAALASLCALLTPLGARWHALTASAATARAPTIDPDGFLPRHPRRRARHSARRVERAVLDRWLMWRM